MKAAKKKGGYPRVIVNELRAAWFGVDPSAVRRVALIEEWRRHLMRQLARGLTVAPHTTLDRATLDGTRLTSEQIQWLESVKRKLAHRQQETEAAPHLEAIPPKTLFALLRLEAARRNLQHHVRGEFLSNDEKILIALAKKFGGRKRGAQSEETKYIDALIKKYPHENTEGLWHILRIAADQPEHAKNPTPGVCPFNTTFGYGQKLVILKGSKPYKRSAFANTVSRLRQERGERS